MCDKRDPALFRTLRNPTAVKAAKTVALALCLTQASFPFPLAAQTTAAVEITPFGGGYFPTSEMPALNQPVCTTDTVTLGSSTGTGTTKAQSGWAAGGRVTRWFANGVGLEGSGSYANTAFPTQGCANGHVGAHVVNVSARLLLRITGGATSLYAIAGYGAFFHGGEAYNDLLASHTDLGGVLGLGARLSLGSRALLQMRAEDYIYYLTLQGKGGTYFTPGGFTNPGFHYHPLQNDFVFSIGVSGSVATDQR